MIRTPASASEASETPKLTRLTLSTTAPSSLMRRMSKHSWFNRAAAGTRLIEIGTEMRALQQEYQLLKALLMDSPTPFDGLDPVSAFPRQAHSTGEPTLSALIARIMKAGPEGRAWTVGELTEAIRVRHPGRLSGKSPSSLISATLSQDLRSKQPVFVARKSRGKRGKLYKLAG